MAQLLQMKPGDFIWTGGDSHIYNCLLYTSDAADDVVMTDPKEFKLNSYDPMDSIKAPMAV